MKPKTIIALLKLASFKLVGKRRSLKSEQDGIIGIINHNGEKNAFLCSPPKPNIVHVNFPSRQFRARHIYFVLVFLKPTFLNAAQPVGFPYIKPDPKIKPLPAHATATKQPAT